MEFVILYQNFYLIGLNFTNAFLYKDLFILVIFKSIILLVAIYFCFYFEKSLIYFHNSFVLINFINARFNLNYI